MAGRGAASSGTRSRPRDQKKLDAAKTVVAADGARHGEDLPDGIEWPAATLTWWDTWRTSPQASTFTATDWSFLLDTAVLHAEFWLGNRGVAAELRLRVAKFGASPEDRARLKLEVGEPPAPSPKPAAAAVKKSAARKQRLLTVVKNDAASTA